MNDGQLKEFRAWFTSYVADFYGDDEFVNSNIKLKEDHSMRVCDEINYLADSLDLEANKRRIAYVCALFHDLGRFRQFIKWRTYADCRSESHSELSLSILKQTGILAALEAEERFLIEQAIKYHGIKELPADLDGDQLLFSKLIRDADKLDIFYVVIKYYGEYEKDPDGFRLEVELPNVPGYTDEFADAILAGDRVDYHKLANWNDMKLLQLGWVYDVNFAVTLKRIREKGYLGQLLGFLTVDEKINQIKEKIFAYVDKRIDDRQDLG